ncbi:MAG: hypothetical protein U0105_24440 [Candidatus Obscuribacterales bacterium]
MYNRGIVLSGGGALCRSR